VEARASGADIDDDVEDMTRTDPSGPANARFEGEEADATVPGGIVTMDDGEVDVDVDASDADESSGAASSSEKRGQARAPAIVPEPGRVVVTREEANDGDSLMFSEGRERESERARALPPFFSMLLRFRF